MHQLQAFDPWQPENRIKNAFLSSLPLICSFLTSAGYEFHSLWNFLIMCDIQVLTLYNGCIYLA